jgi:hypothetical protein
MVVQWDPLLVEMSGALSVDWMGWLMVVSLVVRMVVYWDKNMAVRKAEMMEIQMDELKVDLKVDEMVVMLA